MVAQGACKAREAFTVTSNVMARASAVHTLRTCLAAAVPVEPWRANCRQWSVAGERRGNQSPMLMEQEVYNYWTQHDKSDQGSREKSTSEELKAGETRRAHEGEGESSKGCHYCNHQHFICWLR